MKTLNLMCPINVTEYGYASVNILFELAKQNLVSLFPINPNNMEADIKYHNTIQSCLNNSHLFDVHSPTLRIFHQFSMAESIGRGPRIGLPIFELDKFNNIEKHHLSSLDSILSCSQWASSIIKKELGVDSPVIPLGVDNNIFKPTPTPKNNKTIFFNAGKWEKRKHDIILETFCQAFRQDDNVELWMMCDNIVKPDENIKWQTQYKSSVLSSKIRFIPRKETQQALYEVMKYTHFGFFPSHAEGWNLELLEMMSCGKMCIATNYSAHTEYCNNDNCKLIDVNNVELAYDNIWFHGQGNWAKFDKNTIEQTVSLLRECYKQHQSEEDIYNYNGVKIGEKLTWENTATKIINNLYF